jgi:hypothetical protein
VPSWHATVLKDGLPSSSSAISSPPNTVSSGIQTRAFAKPGWRSVKSFIAAEQRGRRVTVFGLIALLGFYVSDEMRLVLFRNVEGLLQLLGC